MGWRARLRRAPKGRRKQGSKKRWKQWRIRNGLSVKRDKSAKKRSHVF